jgi:hypothetical protein
VYWLSCGKTESSFPSVVRVQGRNVLELIHGDICGPISPMTPSGNWYFILLVDDVSWFMWVKVLATKDQATYAIKQYQAAAEAEIGRKLRAFRSDNVVVYDNNLE